MITHRRRTANRHLLQSCGCVFVMVVFGVGACTDAASRPRSSESSVSIDTAGSIITVANHGPGLWGPSDHWSVHEAFRIGGAEGPPEQLFGNRLISISRGPQGYLYVLDFQADRIKVFSGSGEFIRWFGGEGPGPAELLSPSGMAWDRQGRLWVANGFNGRYTLFDSTGAFIKTVPRPVRCLSRVQHQLMFDSVGYLIDEGCGRSGVLLLRVDTMGAVVDTIVELERPERPDFVLPPGFDNRMLAYLPRLVWTLTPDRTIWSAEAGRLELIQRSLDGDTLRIVRSGHRKAALDAGTRREVERAFSQAGVQPFEYALIRPLVRSIHVLDDGYVLVQIEEEIGQDGPVVDVFDPEGRFLGSLDLGFRLSSRAIPALFGDTIVAPATGEMDVPYVVRASIRRPRQHPPAAQ